MSGTQAELFLRSREQAEESVRQVISSSSEMFVQLRKELLKPLMLRKTKVGRQYVKILKKRRKELLEQRGHRWQVLGRRQDPDGALGRLNMELDHWKKCELPGACNECLFIETQN